eukprot:TRINITY_DN3566_c0_g1_i3.p1 TRINITY_DN3566_c0_g1~~TRINITY_DN3566_c0_g1_i3.p1  ORF type:complete len:280 (-),score=72.65 TRINITY_DN3566_c0_g1_i3:132-971(-)
MSSTTSTSSQAIKRPPADEMDDVSLNEIPDRRIWLVKIPKKLHQHWFSSASSSSSSFSSSSSSSAPFDPSRDVGMITVDPSSRGIQLTIANAPPSIPNKYNMTLRAIPQETPTKVFLDDDGVTFSGSVESKLDMEPVSGGDADYRALMRARSVISNRKDRQIKTISATSHEDAAPALMAPSLFRASNPDWINRNSKKEERLMAKRVSRNKDEVLDMLFAAFEKKPFYNLEGLVTLTEQPHQHLKNILADVAIKHVKGPNRNMYELKPEFRSSTSATSNR